MKKSEIKQVVLARLKSTSRFAKREKKSLKFREFYKLGINNDFLYFLEGDDDSSVDIVNYSDVACIYCIDNGSVKSVPADIFFKIYRNYFSS